MEKESEKYKQGQEHSKTTTDGIVRVVGNTIVFVGGSTKGPYCPRDMFPRLLNDVHCLRLAQKTDGNYVRSKVIIHSNQSKHRAPTRIFELKDINGL